MKRSIGIAVAALAASALAIPSSAFAGASHLAGYYKVEKHIDMEGESGTYSISCPNNDIAVDGMWRIDNVDQDDDYIYAAAPSTPHYGKLDVLNSVEPAAAYPDVTSVSKWWFMFVPLSGGDVQGKLFLFCLPHRPNTNQAHSVDWLPSVRKSTSGTVVAPSGGGKTYSNGFDGHADLTSGTLTTTTCGPGEIAIQPGFEWTSADSYGKPYRRAPVSFSGSTQWRQWKWGFFTPTGGTVTLYWRCLPLLSDWSNQPVTPTGHRHKLVVKSKLGTTPVADTIKAADDTTLQVICGEHYKLGLAAWDFNYGGYTWNAGDYWKKFWYLGMDPRPKARAFRILNTDVLAHPSSEANLAGLCFKDKTT
jgi:hypothetical protein